MGNKASRVYGTLIKRPLQRYNVEYRAEKVVKKIEDPSAAAMRAPMYQSDAELLEEIRRQNPTMAEQAVRKDDDLHHRLKSVYVESTDPVVEEVPQSDPSKPLPRDTSQYSYDFVPAQLRLDTTDRKARTLPRGKVTLEQTVDILTQYKMSEENFDHLAIADQYRLNPEKVKQAVKYFTIFNMMETKTREAETTTPDPLVAGKDWVEKLQNPGDSFNKQMEQRDQLLEAKERRKMRVEKEKLKLREAGDHRTD